MHRLGRGKAAKKATREAPEEDPEFQISQMIDIFLVLLVFFMAISSTEVLQTNDHVQLPVALLLDVFRHAQEKTSFHALRFTGAAEIDQNMALKSRLGSVRWIMKRAEETIAEPDLIGAQGELGGLDCRRH